MGNFQQIFDPQSGWGFLKLLGEQYPRVARVYGLFGSKHLHIHDSKALHHILVKDQAIFEETQSSLVSNIITFGGGLASTTGVTILPPIAETRMIDILSGEQHKRQRKMLNPVFSIAHMRKMIPMFNDVTQKLVKAIKAKLATGTQEVDILHWMSRAALEMIGQSGLGYSFDPLVEGATPHAFAAAAKTFVPAMSKMFIEAEYLLPTLTKIGTPRFRRWLVDLVPYKSLHEIRDIVDIWDATSTEILEGKKQALREGDEALAKQVGQAKDLMSILIKANMEASEEDRLSDKEVLAQASLFNVLKHLT
ncbi:hypothetical protein H0H93_010515 [Arthromyces matolae]|nr:hypothetical protein H0H93_010515 [Arthromyces matolae]